MHKVDNGIDTSAERSVELEEGTERTQQEQRDRKRTQMWSSREREGECGWQAESTE